MSSPSSSPLISPRASSRQRATPVTYGTAASVSCSSVCPTIAISGTAFLVHEQNDWWFARSAFLHHLLGWTLVLGALIVLAGFFRPRSLVLQSGLAVVLIALSVMLYSDRDVAPVFGHLSPLAGEAHR